MALRSAKTRSQEVESREGKHDLGSLRPEWEVVLVLEAPAGRGAFTAVAKNGFWGLVGSNF